MLPTMWIDSRSRELGGFRPVGVKQPRDDESESGEKDEDPRGGDSLAGSQGRSESKGDRDQAHGSREVAGSAQPAVVTQGVVAEHRVDDAEAGVEEVKSDVDQQEDADPDDSDRAVQPGGHGTSLAAVQGHATRQSGPRACTRHDAFAVDSWRERGTVRSGEPFRRG